MSGCVMLALSEDIDSHCVWWEHRELEVLASQMTFLAEASARSVKMMVVVYEHDKTKRVERCLEKAPLIARECGLGLPVYHLHIQRQ